MSTDWPSLDKCGCRSGATPSFLSDVADLLDPSSWKTLGKKGNGSRTLPYRAMGDDLAGVFDLCRTSPQPKGGELADTVPLRPGWHVQLRGEETDLDDWLYSLNPPFDPVALRHDRHGVLLHSEEVAACGSPEDASLTYSRAVVIGPLTAAIVR